MPDVDGVPADGNDDLDLLIHHARAAGEIAMGFFRQDPTVWMKAGESPVSEADFAVDAYLRQHLRAARPDLGWLSEETEDEGEARQDAARLFVVDPIDGTRGFLKGMKRWCVSVAIVEDGRPIHGVLYCPAMKRTFSASLGGGAWLDGVRLHCAAPRGALRVVGPKSIRNRTTFPAGLALEDVDWVPSLAYRLAMVACGEADVALSTAGSHDWDIAAADLIVSEAGGVLAHLDASPIVYNKPVVRHGDMVCAGAELYRQLREAG